ncbi:MAG: efflux RND transporter periplasmic adaptor subunit [Candidatus Muirbacterium halophilum]|nr:efflux RND transporter periplasmic adaptor subunit [Candidatus Muirbacterium halophilum]MCK9475155.1 efflux RND transporter periplasmic adaptor subunit [Candidatus Muirbacterium halophilum]
MISVFKKTFLISIFFIFLMTGCEKLSKASSDEIEEISVKTIDIKISELDYSASIAGTAHPIKEINVKSDLMSSKIKKIYFREGDIVKKGDVVVEFEDREHRLSISQEKLRFEDSKSGKQKAQVEKEEQVFGIEKELTESEADYLRKQIYFNKANDEVETKKQLFRINAATLEELKSAERELEKTEIDLKAAKSNYDTLMKMFSKEKNLRLEKFDIIIKQADNNIKKSQLELERLNMELEKFSVKAPINGIISELDIIENMQIDGSEPFLFRIIDISDILVSVNVSESDIFKVEKDKEASIVFDAMKKNTFIGLVYSVKPVIDMTSRSFPVEIKLSNNNNLIRPGMFCRVDFSNSEKKKGIFIHGNIIRKTGNSSFVFKVKNNVAVKTLITTGFEKDGVVEILSGLSENDIVISEGIDRVRDLATVKVIK